MLSGAAGRRQAPFDETHPAYACNSGDFQGRKAATAQAKIVGDDPLQMKIINIEPRIEARPPVLHAIGAVCEVPPCPTPT